LLAGRLPLPHSQLRILRFQEEGLEIRLASLAQLVCQRQGRERSRGEGIIKRRLRQERSLDPQRADEGCSKEALRTLADDRHDPPRSQVQIRQPRPARIPTRLRHPSPALSTRDIGPLRGSVGFRRTQGDDRKRELLQTTTVRLELLTNQRNQLDNHQNLPPQNRGQQS